LFVQNPQTTELSNQKKTRMRRSKRRLESRSALARFPFSRFNRMKFGRVEYAPWSIEGPVLEELKWIYLTFNPSLSSQKRKKC